MCSLANTLYDLNMNTSPNETQPSDMTQDVLFVCLFVVLAGVVPSLETNDDEVVDVLYRVQGMRLADAPRPRNTTPGGG